MVLPEACVAVDVTVVTPFFSVKSYNSTSWFQIRFSTVNPSMAPSDLRHYGGADRTWQSGQTRDTNWGNSLLSPKGIPGMGVAKRQDVRSF